MFENPVPTHPIFLSTMIIQTTPEKVLEFGRFAHLYDRADFYDWLEVLEFLDYLQTIVQEAKPEVVDAPREELVVVVASSIQFWKAAMEMGFLGMDWSASNPREAALCA